MNFYILRNYSESLEKEKDDEISNLQDRIQELISERDEFDERLEYVKDEKNRLQDKIYDLQDELSNI